jgi:hypothetical protein
LSKALPKPSERATAFLRTLPRKPHVSVADAERRLRDSEIEVVDSWLETHERYAGFVQPLLLETATWGIVHDQPEHLPADGFDFDTDPTDSLIACADAHPSFDYWLDASGAFLGIGSGGPCDSFTTYVEQLALFADHGWIPLAPDVAARAAGRTLGMPPDPAPSDSHRTWWVLPDLLICVPRDTSLPTLAWSRSK